MSAIVSAPADELRVFFARIKPYYREFFNVAHAICGNFEVAEFAVQSAILECYRGGGPIKSRVGLRESLRAQVRRAAMEQAALMDDVELTWDGFREDVIDGAQGDFILQAATQESAEGRRMLMLRYGCGLRAREIARLTGTQSAQVSGVLTRFERRVKRRLPPRERARAESRIVKSARAWLETQQTLVPDPGAVYRSLEAELMEAGTPGRRVSRLLFHLLSVLLAALLALIFWTMMVLLEAPEMEEPAPAATAAFMPAQTAEPSAGALEETAPSDGDFAPAQAADFDPAQAADFAPAADSSAQGAPGGSGTYFDYLP